MSPVLNRRSILRRVLAVAATAAAASGALAVPAPAAQAAQSAVYTSTNSATANSVVVFQRDNRGALHSTASYPTGGTGTGSGLGNQGALALSPDGDFLFVVNAGSNDISVFAVRNRRLSLLRRVPSGGSRPVSLTVHGSLLYVLNAGVPNNITGFAVQNNGSLAPLPNSTQALSGIDTSPAQVGFDPFGGLLVVTERATRTLNVFPVDGNGVAGPGVRSPSVGSTPFGFSFDPAGRLFVSEAGTSSLSSYYVSSFGFLTISGSAPTLQAAPCWVAVSGDGDFVYTGNAGASRSITGLRVARNGVLTESTVVATGLDGCTDLAVSGDGKFLFALENLSGSVRSFRVNDDGSLTFIGSYGDLGPGFTGLVTR